jgi:hypothetical protein
MSQPVFNIAQDRCQNLRWKALFIDPESDPMQAEHLWCVQSQHALGPDGKLVDKYECNPARGCYKAL